MKENVINDTVEKVNRAMSQEGMPLTDEEKNNLKEIIIGKKTYDEIRKKIIDESIKRQVEVKKK